MTNMSDIVREHHDTGAYGNAHIRLSDQAKARMEDIHTPEATYPWRINLAAVMFGIPVIVDDTIQPDTWRLVDNTTGETLHTGVIE